MDKTKIVRTRIYKQSYRQFICFALFFVNRSNQYKKQNKKTTTTTLQRWILCTHIYLIKQFFWPRQPRRKTFLPTIQRFPSAYGCLTSTVREARGSDVVFCSKWDWRSCLVYLPRYKSHSTALSQNGFESLLERQENFLLQGRLSVLTLISVSVPPPCYHSST